MTLLESWSEEYLATNSTYAPHIIKFVKYIKHIGKSDKPTKISLEDVESCIGYYNELGKFNSFATMENHLSSVQSFYKFLVSKSWAVDIFRDIYDYASYKDKIAQRFNLAEGKEREYFREEVVREILDKLDKYFEQNDYSCLHGMKKKKYKHYLVLRIFIKVNLIAPAKKSIIFNLIKRDFSSDYRIVKVNGIEIHVPNALRRDLREGIQFAEKISGKRYGESQRIFEFLNIEKLVHSDLNGWFCSFLREFDIVDIPQNKYTYSIEALRNSVIVELIKNGVDLSLISKVCGVNTDSLEKWYFKVNAYDEGKINDLINQGVSRNSYYSYI